MRAGLARPLTPALALLRGAPARASHLMSVPPLLPVAGIPRFLHFGLPHTGSYFHGE